MLCLTRYEDEALVIFNQSEEYYIHFVAGAIIKIRDSDYPVYTGSIVNLEKLKVKIRFKYVRINKKHKKCEYRLSIDAPISVGIDRIEVYEVRKERVGRLHENNRKE